jgi:hypothetical protein
VLPSTTAAIIIIRAAESKMRVELTAAAAVAVAPTMMIV